MPFSSWQITISFVQLIKVAVSTQLPPQKCRATNLRRYASLTIILITLVALSPTSTDIDPKHPHYIHILVTLYLTAVSLSNTLP